MHNKSYVFAQLASHLDRNKFNYLVRKYQGDSRLPPGGASSSCSGSRSVFARLSQATLEICSTCFLETDASIQLSESRSTFRDSFGKVLRFSYGYERRKPDFTFYILDFFDGFQTSDK